MDKNKIYKEFKKDDPIWKDTIFYTIYEKDNVKRLKIIGFTYTYWGVNSYKERDYYVFLPVFNKMIDEELDVLLEWGDINYGLSQHKKSKYMSENIITDTIEEAESEGESGNFKQTYEFANRTILGEDKQGSKMLDLFDVKKDTPVGNYFGTGII